MSMEGVQEEGLAANEQFSKDSRKEKKKEKKKKKKMDSVPEPHKDCRPKDILILSQ